MRRGETSISPLGRAIDPAEILRPIEFLRQDHDRLRSFCDGLGALVDDIHQSGYQELASSLLEFAITDLPRSMENKKELLAPALMERCAPEDDPKQIVSDLLRRQRFAAKFSPRTIDGLVRLAAGLPPSRPLNFIVSALQHAEVLRRQLDWEDGVLLPLAASRLTEEDQKSLGNSMARRRGMRLPVTH